MHRKYDPAILCPGPHCPNVCRSRVGLPVERAEVRHTWPVSDAPASLATRPRGVPAVALASAVLISIVLAFAVIRVTDRLAAHPRRHRPRRRLRQAVRRPSVAGLPAHRTWRDLPARCPAAALAPVPHEALHRAPATGPGAAVVRVAERSAGTGLRAVPLLGRVDRGQCCPGLRRLVRGLPGARVPRDPPRRRAPAPAVDDPSVRRRHRHRHDPDLGRPVHSHRHQPQRRSPRT